MTRWLDNVLKPSKAAFEGNILTEMEPVNLIIKLDLLQLWRLQWNEWKVLIASLHLQ